MVRTGELAMLLKFIAVGLSGVLVNMGVYWLLTRYTGLKSIDWLAVLIGIEASILTNFILNDTFTFARRRAGKTFIGRILKFNFISAAGAGTTSAYPGTPAGSSRKMVLMSWAALP